MRAYTQQACLISYIRFSRGADEWTTRQFAGSLLADVNCDVFLITTLVAPCWLDRLIVIIPCYLRCVIEALDKRILCFGEAPWVMELRLDSLCNFLPLLSQRASPLVTLMDYC